MNLAQELHRLSDGSMSCGYYWRQIQLAVRDGCYSASFPIEVWNDIDLIKKAKAWFDANGFTTIMTDKEFKVEW